MHLKTVFLFLSILLVVNCEDKEEEVNVVEFAYLEGSSSNIEGVTEEFPTTTEGFLPVHPDLKDSDKFSVPPAKGKEIKLGNLTIYESPFNSSNSQHLLITIYDIFGFHPHVKYIADELAKEGFLVVIPDLLYGNPVGLKDFPQPDFQERAVHLFERNGSWVENKPDLVKLIQHYKEKYNVTKIGMYGYCWGGKIIVYAASDPQLSDINAFGLVHPSRVTTQDSNEFKVPAILLPSKSEPDMIPFLDILNENIKGNKSEHFRYNHASHGFAGARSDFSDPYIRLQVGSVIQRLSKFFTKIFDQ